LGFDGLWVQQHLFYPHHPPSGYHRSDVPLPEQYRSVYAPTELLAAAAAWTEHIRLGTSVLVAGYHRPVDIAQRLATLDQLSDGRLIAGFAVGWSYEEHEQMGTDPTTRGSRAEELVDAVLACWGPDPVEFHGRFFSIPRADVNPKPVQVPHPPLLSGMASPAGLRRTLRQYDIWNPVGEPEDLLLQVEKLNAVRAPGRQPLEVYARVFTQPPGRRASASQLGATGVIEHVRKACTVGLNGVIIDCNFWETVGCEVDWTGVPDLFAEAVDLARNGRHQPGG
jgi:probable F420-dependent oxidoreductase